MRLQAEKNFFVPRYNDTTEANLNKGIDSCGALIFSRDVNAFYYRACNPKRWTAIAGGSGSTPTLQQVLTAGSTVTSNNTITGGTTTLIQQNVGGRISQLSIDTTRTLLRNMAVFGNRTDLDLRTDQGLLYTIQGLTTGSVNTTNTSSFLKVNRTIPSLNYNFGVDLGGAYWLNSSDKYYFPTSLGTTGQILKLTTPNQMAWANDSTGGGGDTTSLSNRINQAFTSATKISDTSFFMSSPTGTNDTITLNGAPVYVESPIMARVSNDSNIIYFNADTANAWRGGSGVTPTLQQVTTAGNITADSIVVQDITLKNPSGATGLSTSIYLGYGSTYSDLSSIGTIAIGHQVMDGSTPSGQSVVIGATAGQFSVPNDCVLIGEQAGGFMSNVGSPNGNLDAVGVGHQSLYGASGVQDGVFLGAYSGKSSTGEQVVAIGNQSGESNSKDTTIFIGYSSGRFNSGNRLIAIGGYAGQNNTYNDGIALGAGSNPTADSQLVVSSYINKLKLPGLAKGVPNYVLTDTSGNGDLVLALGGGGPTDTTSLSNRIDSKIDSLERRADSIYAFKNGQWNFQYKTLSTNTGGGASVNYYLNGSVSQGTFGGDTYYQLSKTPIAGAGTNFTRTNASGNGYIASFITDAGDPNLLNIPGGNWNLEFYFNSSSSGGTPSFYGEIYKVSATNVFTLIASGSTNPEAITNGTVVDQYFTSVPMPQTTLVATDRIAIRIFVITGGRNITLHTEDNNLSEVLTTFSTGLNALNGLTTQVQYFQTGASGTDFNISSASDMHTFNIPNASTVGVTRGLISNTEYTAKFNTADTNLLQQKSLPAYSIMGNNTSAAANATAIFFKDTSGTYTGSPNWTGVAPTSGTFTYRWTRIGKLVTLNITLVYAVLGTTLTGVAIPLPTDCPSPAIPSGLSSALNLLYPATFVAQQTTNGLPLGNAPRAFLRNNTGNNGFEIMCSFASSSIIQATITTQYTAQ
jgi:hypothetical protein